VHRYIPPMPSLRIEPDDPRRDDIQDLLESHMGLMRDSSPPEHIHALDTDGLLAPNVSFYSLREDGYLLGVGALKEIDPAHGEIKSMHTRTDARGRGLGRMILEHLLAMASTRGYRRVSLETGTMEQFAAARALYVSAGFEVCEPFGSYWDNEFSVCMTLYLGT